MVLQNCQVLSSALLEAIKLLFFVQDLGEFPIREFVCISYDWYSVDFMEFLVLPEHFIALDIALDNDPALGLVVARVLYCIVLYCMLVARVLCKYSAGY